MQKLARSLLAAAQDKSLAAAPIRILIVLSSGELDDYPYEFLAERLGLTRVTVHRAMILLARGGYVVKGSSFIDGQALVTWRTADIAA